MKYTGVFTRHDKECELELRVKIEADTPKQAFYKITMLRYRDELWDFKKIEDSKGKCIMNLTNGTANDCEKIHEYIKTIDGIEISKPILIQRDAIEQLVRAGDIVCNNVWSIVNDKKVDLTVGNISFTAPVDTIQGAFVYLLENEPLKYDEVKNTIDKMIEKYNISAGKYICYDEVFSGLRSGYIDYHYEPYNHELRVKIGAVAAITLVKQRDVDYFSSNNNDGVDLSAEIIRETETTIKEFPLNIQEAIRSKIKEHTWDRVPDEVKCAALNNPYGTICVVCMKDIRTEEYDCFTFQPLDKNLNPCDFDDCMSETDFENFIDFIGSFTEKENYTDMSLYIINKEKGNLSDYNITTDYEICDLYSKITHSAEKIPDERE